MIKQLKIENFKSIKHLEIPCKKVNLFIGEPNVGKSNILEALGFLCWTASNEAISDFIRLEDISNLFHDGLIDKQINIEIFGPSITEYISNKANVDVKALGASAFSN